jgi:hypothetical protein
MDMGRIDDTYLLLLECSIVHRDGLGFYFGMIKCDFFFSLCLFVQILLTEYSLLLCLLKFSLALPDAQRVLVLAN